jgi:hypothetical protein
MMGSPIETIKVEEVEAMPKTFRPGVLYVSYEFETASHLCCCGCGTRVVTPLGLGRWSLSQELNGPTLSPSIGNTSRPCRSHYFIRNGRVSWAQEMSDEEHLFAIAADRKAAVEALAPTLGCWDRFKLWVMNSIRRLLSRR